MRVYSPLNICHNTYLPFDSLNIVQLHNFISISFFIRVMQDEKLKKYIIRQTL